MYNLKDDLISKIKNVYFFKSSGIYSSYECVDYCGNGNVIIENQTIYFLTDGSINEKFLKYIDLCFLMDSVNLKCCDGLLLPFIKSFVKEGTKNPIFIDSKFINFVADNFDFNGCLNTFNDWLVNNYCYLIVQERVEWYERNPGIRRRIGVKCIEFLVGVNLTNACLNDVERTSNDVPDIIKQDTRD